MNELKIEYLSPEELTPYENNTRKHTPDDIEGIKKSILADGFNDPIGIWGKDNLIVEGHGRQIVSMGLATCLLECVIGVCDTPFLYLAKKLKHGDELKV